LKAEVAAVGFEVPLGQVIHAKSTAITTRLPVDLSYKSAPEGLLRTRHPAQPRETTPGAPLQVPAGAHVDGLGTTRVGPGPTPEWAR
jgi:hypothetical protein